MMFEKTKSTSLPTKVAEFADQIRRICLPNSLSLLFVLLFVVSQNVFGWDGKGTSTDPYLIATSADWQQLATDVNGGTDYRGKVFRLTQDVDAGGVMVGTDASHAFSGTFDGDGHVLTFNKQGTGDDPRVNERCAPFRYVSGATILHLRTTGYVAASHQYAGGVVSMVEGPGVTTLSDCQSDMVLHGHPLSNAAFGGLVGAVNAGGLVMDRCLFTGSIDADSSAGMVGWSNVSVTISNSMVNPEHRIGISNGRTFARMAGGATLTLTDCYYTSAIEPEGTAAQGIGVLTGITVPEGCSYQIESEPDFVFGGQPYWKSGVVVTLNAPEGAAFDHWTSGLTGCYISDPWQRSGQVVLGDIAGNPILSIATDGIGSGETRDMDGTVYRYLRAGDYHYYVSNETCRAKGWELKDGYLQKYVAAEDKWAYITAVTGWKSGSIPSDGAQIHNDLTGDWHAHTLTGVIAAHAFDGCTELKTLYFKDTDANNYNALQDFDFVIGDLAFANCPNLTEVKMMQYTTRGSNHWEYIRPMQVTAIAANAFTGSPKARVSCHREVYQEYMGSEVWKPFRSRIIVYDATVEDFKVDGVVYHMYRDAQEVEPLSSNDRQAMMDNHLRLWSADYQQLTPASLLTLTDESQKVWYTSVTGVDDSYLKSHDGKVVILNDLGTYYNYKTICLGRTALADNENVKSIEFRQVNGNQTSRSDLKMVIQNGALKGCKNLKELRLFYWCEDGDDHWEVLGPENVIPGDDIFGRPTPAELEGMTEEQRAAALDNYIPKGFKILVSPDRVAEFLTDPNWCKYLSYIEAVDYNPNGQMDDFTIGDQKGITYGYITGAGGVMETSQTVSQDVSWFTAVRIVYEVTKTLLGFKSTYDDFIAYQLLQQAANELDNSFESLKPVLKALLPYLTKGTFIANNAPASSHKGQLFLNLLQKGLVDNNGKWIASARWINRLNVTIGWRTTFFQYFPDYLRSVSSSYLKSFTTQLDLLPVLQTASIAGAVTSARLWGNDYNGDQLQKGMRENIKANMHQVGIVGGGYVYTVPTKNIAYHTYIKEVKDNVTHAVIYAGTDKGQGQNANTVTTAFAKKAFRNKKKLTHVSFFENNVSTNEAVPMVLTIPDSAFVGCTNLKELRLLLQTKSHGTQALGPESFILAGDSIFAGLSPKKFHIVIDPSRKQDFLNSESWKPLEKYFVYEAAEPKCAYNEYGGQYAYVYENGSVQKVHKEQGHKIEHTIVIGATTDGGYLLSKHQGALKLCNDIGEYNNYQLDAVRAGAFKGNQDLRMVNFTDLYGSGAFGDSYTGLSMELGDSCFAHCPNLANVDLLYLVTDGDNHIDPITPQQVRIGRGVLDGTTAKFKMLPQQVEWFEADTTWNKYRDRFMPCIIKPGDDAVRKSLKDFAYYDMAATGYDPYYWTDYIDLARIAGAGYNSLKGKFSGNKDIRTFADFQHFESVGLDFVGEEWFKDCSQLSNIVLPKTIEQISSRAFQNCAKLKEIVLPEKVNAIMSEAFGGCTALQSIVVNNTKPATLLATNAFPENAGMKIYVPTGTVNAYKQAWPVYADYIVGMDTYKTNKVVTVEKAGTLADKLGLDVEWSYTGVLAGDEPRYLHGSYSRYDSLTVSGPLNDLDLAVLRYLAGSDSYNNNGGDPTDGRLRYLNLYGASIVKDGACKAHYANTGTTYSYAWSAVEEDDMLPDYLFTHCRSLETVILPRSVKKIGTGIFKACSALKRVAMTGSISAYDKPGYIDGQLSYPLDELVFLTDTPAMSDCGDPWQQDISMVFTKKSQMTDYLNQTYLTNHAKQMKALFEDDAIMESLAVWGQFFPSEYLARESVEGLFANNRRIDFFDDFNLFSHVKELDRTFAGTSSMESITLPDSIQRIGRLAFSSCYNLKTIRISTQAVPTLEEDAFEQLADNFQILVPKSLCKAYREKWSQYADHINPDMENYANSDITVVTTKEKNTLAKELGFEVTYDMHKANSDNQYNQNKVTFISSVRGDYSKIKRLKVVGPISGADLCLLRYLSGFCAWANTRNEQGLLEYIDLYDAELQASEYEAASDMYWSFTKMNESYVARDNELPAYAFLQAYNLKTLILPKTLTKVESRALQQCENLETLVVGDDMTDFNWSALDDCAMLSKLYLLAKKKPSLPMDCWLWRNLCNNYHPTFDAFYVRPSIYGDYLKDDAYTGLTWQRTNNISKGEFQDDASFCAFAAHAAATKDELSNVDNVQGWFANHTDIRDLTPLRYTAIDTLLTADIQPLTRLERVALPASLLGIGDSAFVKSPQLRYVDMLSCDSVSFVEGVREKGLKKLGIDTQRTLVYLPARYGATDETNVVVASAPASESSSGNDAASSSSDGSGDASGASLKAACFRLVDDRDYLVPYSFEAEKIENSRSLPKHDIPYTVCVPYTLDVPQYARAFKLSDRDGSTLTFKELAEGEKMEALQPYLLKVVGNKRFRKSSTTLNSNIRQTIPATGGMTYGRQVDVAGYSLRGTLDAVDNKTAADMGAYVLQGDGNWHPVSAATADGQKASVLPFRAFLLPSARNAGAPAIDMELIDATDIDTIETIDRDGTRRYYDLQGREVDASHKGVVISGGKKYFNK